MLRILEYQSYLASQGTLVAKTMWALGQSRDASEIQRLFYSQVNHDRIPMA